MEASGTRTVMLVSGMRDNACREQIAESLEAVPGVSEVCVTLYRARATVMHTTQCDPKRLIAAIQKCGCSASIVRED